MAESEELEKLHCACGALLLRANTRGNRAVLPQVRAKRRTFVGGPAPGVRWTIGAVVRAL